MTLYEEWMSKAYNKKGESEKYFWDIYMPKEQKIYEEIIGKNITHFEGIVKELAAKYQMESSFVCGFLDGVNESIDERIDIENITEDTFISINFNFKELYKKMVEYKATHLYSLPEWDNIFTEEERKVFYKEQKSSGTVIKVEKIGRNDPCPCGSGKKYKKCCGQD